MSSYGCMTTDAASMLFAAALICLHSLTHEITPTLPKKVPQLATDFSVPTKTEKPGLTIDHSELTSPKVKRWINPRLGCKLVQALRDHSCTFLNN